VTDNSNGSSDLSKVQTTKVNELGVQYQAIIDAFEGFIYICSHDQRIEFMNRKSIERHGSDIMGEPCYKIIHKLEKTCPWCEKNRVLCGETVRQEIVSPLDGRWYRIVNAPVYYKDGTVSILAIANDIDEYKQTQQLLRESKVCSKMRIDQVADAVMIFDKNERIVEVNAQLCVLMGYTNEELVGQQVLHLLSEDELSRAPLRYDLLKQGQVIRNEQYFKRKNGSLIFIESNSKMMPDGYFQSILRDATERKHAEEALRFSEEKFSKAFKISPDSINLNRLEDGVYLDVNEGFLAITGYTEEEVIGRSSLPGALGIWVNKEDRNKLVSGLKSNGEVIGLEAPFRKKDGTIIYGIMSARIMEIKGVKCLLSITRDITDKKIQDDALRQSEKQYRELANSLPLGIFEANLKGLMTFVNSTALEWFGYSHTQIDLGINVLQTIAPQYRVAGMENMKHILAGNKNKPNEYLAIRKDGSTFSVLIMTNSIVDKDGLVTGFRGIVVDMTEQKQVESALQNTQKLEALGVLAGGIAHDFNNLLAGIFGYLDIAREWLLDGSTAQAGECLEKAGSVFNRAKSLTQQLLTFSKGGAPVKKRISINTVLRDMVQFSLSGSSSKAVFDLSDNLWVCEADVHQMGQVIDNIIINARQAMPLGGEILITARNISENHTIPKPLPQGRYITIAIKDCGIGIPQEIISRIFDPFFTTKQQGSGLGLATTYSIVKKHGGHIFVESIIGKGSTFTIYLPALQNEMIAEAEVSNVIQKISNCTILLMDDEEFMRDIGAIALEELGCNLVTVANAEEAIGCFEKRQSEGKSFDLLILDLTIPGGMGGLQVLQELLQRDPTLKAIASSGYSDDPVMADPLKFGFKSKLAKPYLKTALQEIVRSMVDTSSRT
jgi:PAS domain S-box-containing protein